MTTEKQRFYRAVSQQLNGTAYELKFRADNMQEARHHAEHCFRVDGRGLSVAYVNFLGTIEPPLMGEIRPY